MTPAENLRRQQAAAARKGPGKGSPGVLRAPRTECRHCKALFYAKPSQRKRGGGKFCSNKCFGASLVSSLHFRTCAKCGDKFSFDGVLNTKCCPSCKSQSDLAKERRALPQSIRGCAKCGGFLFNPNAKYCSVACRGAASRRPEGAEKVLPMNSTCVACSAPFYASPGHKAAGWGLYCGMKCRPLPQHSGAKGGTRPDLGFYVRSSWEANYARYLKWLEKNGQIERWEYEPETFQFEPIKRGNKFYTPDFRVTELGGKVVFHEVKGYMDADSKVKLKRMAKYYPQFPVVLIDGKVMADIKKKLSSLIEHWETNKNDKLDRRK